VDDTLLVGCGQSIGEWDGDLEDPIRGHPAFGDQL
jgi:hypothetical protein